MNQTARRFNTAIRRDEKPWYKQFWPWFIISLPVTSVIVSMTILWLAVSNPDRSVLNDADYQALRNELKARPVSGFESDTKSNEKTGKPDTPNTP